MRVLILAVNARGLLRGELSRCAVFAQSVCKWYGRCRHRGVGAGRAWQEAPSFQKRLLATELGLGRGPFGQDTASGTLRSTLSQTGLCGVSSGPDSVGLERWCLISRGWRWSLCTSPHPWRLPGISLQVFQCDFFSVGYFERTLGSSIHECQGNGMGFMLSFLLCFFANPITNAWQHPALFPQQACWWRVSPTFGL